VFVSLIFSSTGQRIKGFYVMASYLSLVVLPSFLYHFFLKTTEWILTNLSQTYICIYPYAWSLYKLVHVAIESWQISSSAEVQFGRHFEKYYCIFS